LALLVWDLLRFSPRRDVIIAIKNSEVLKPLPALEIHLRWRPHIDLQAWVLPFCWPRFQRLPRHPYTSAPSMDQSPFNVTPVPPPNPGSTRRWSSWTPNDRSVRVKAQPNRVPCLQPLSTRKPDSPATVAFTAHRWVRVPRPGTSWRNARGSRWTAITTGFPANSSGAT